MTSPERAQAPHVAASVTWCRDFFSATPQPSRAGIRMVRTGLKDGYAGMNFP